MPAEQITSIDSQKLRTVQLRLADIAAKVALAEEVIRNGNPGNLWVFRWASCQLGLERLEAFAGELQRSTMASMNGEPFTSETEKNPRKQPKTAKKSAKKKT